MVRDLILLVLPLIFFNVAYSFNATASTMPVISYVTGTPSVFATHDKLASLGFAWGPSDGTFGAIPESGVNYTFYGTAGSASSCVGTPNANGAFTFTGTLSQVSGSNGCTRLFGPGDGPPGWLFDANYAGGGQVLRFTSNAQSGWLMPFHAEEWWQNPTSPDHKCDDVNCFYSSIGLAVSTDNGKTFTVAGEILQPSQPFSVFQGGGRNMAVGTGSMVVADVNGKHLDNPPSDPSSAYFYLFYTDLSPGLPGACANAPCIGVARAPYINLVQAALSDNPHLVATAFHKYVGATPEQWNQPATSDTLDQSGTAGVYTPLWTDESVSQPDVIYDSSLNLYLIVYQSHGGLEVRASYDLINWSSPLGSGYAEAGSMLYAPTILGETGDPTIAGPAPRLYFTSFPTTSFPNWKTSTFKSLQLNFSGNTDQSSTVTTTSIVGLSAPYSWFDSVPVLVMAAIAAAVTVMITLRIRRPTQNQKN